MGATQRIPQCITCPCETARHLQLQAPAASGTCIDKSTCCKRMNEVKMPELKYPT